MNNDYERYDFWHRETKQVKKSENTIDQQLHISDFNDKPFYMSSKSDNKPDYNTFGYHEYKQYDI